MTKLKPCPFCGGEADVINAECGQGEIYAIQCGKCQAKIGWFDEVKEAIEVWNTRPSPWHTGTPTDEGWYVVKYKCIHEGKYYEKIEYHTMYIYADSFGNMIISGRASDDVWQAIEYMKIDDAHTPFRASKE